MPENTFVRVFRNLTTLGLVSLLAVGSPGVAAASGSVERESARISVATAPEGAMVYLDGVARGLTPVELDDVEVGSHRVTLLKDGFLENSQLVTVETGKKKEIEVSLTESAGTRHSMQVSSSGGGGSKWPLILAIAGGGAVGAYFLLRETNNPPSPPQISVNPTTDLLASVTSVSFTASASDPDGDTLTYEWDFGDGSSGTGQTANHTYQREGTFTVTLTVDDGKESASSTASVNVRSLASSWSGEIRSHAGSGRLPFGVDFTQSGTSLGGTFRALGDTGSVAGQLSAPNNVRFSVTIPGFAPFTFTGTVAASLNAISGSVQGSGFTGEPFTMTR